MILLVVNSVIFGSNRNINKEKYLVAMGKVSKAVYLVKYQAKRNRFVDAC